MTDKSVPALDAGLTLVEAIADAGASGMTFSALLARGLPKASLARQLATLVGRGWLTKLPSGNYVLGSAALRLVSRGDPVQGIRLATECLLPALMSATGNTTLAVSWDGTALIGAAKAVCEHAVPMQDIGTVTIDLGSQPWGWFTAELCALPATWPRPSCRTYFLRHGVAWDPGLRNPHLHRLAAPLIVEGKLRGALVLGGTPLTLPASSLPVMTERLLAVAQAVCVRLRACG